jgi:hypothetical protein
MKKMVTAIKDMQIKSTLRFNLMYVRKATSRTQTTTNVDEDEMKKEPSYTDSENVS